MAKTAADCTTMAEIRENIDRVDRALMALFSERWSFIGRAAEIKAGLGIPADVPERVKRRLQQRLERLLHDDVAAEQAGSDRGIDPNRLAQEIALLAERADVTEELVRLASHLEQARALIHGSGASGRRLDFLVQEIGRELNTIGSKSAATEISSAIVEAKAVLEKVREQVQNVE